MDECQKGLVHLAISSFCAGCEYLHNCALGQKKVFNKSFKNKGPDEVTNDFIYGRGEFSILRAQIRPIEIARDSKRYKDIVNGFRGTLGLNPL